MDLAQEIQKVINTLESLRITSDYDTMYKLVGSMQVLAKVRDSLKEEPHGDDHAE